MFKSKLMLIASVWALFSAACRGQAIYTNLPVPATKLEALETNIGVVIIKGTAPVGSVSANAAMVSVTCKEDTNTGTGQKEYGILVGIRFGDQPEDDTMIDYEELDPLLNAMDYFGKIDWTVTTLPAFDAFYATKAGFRISAFGSKRSGTMQFTVRSNRMSRGIALTAEQMARFRELIGSARHTLDTIRPGK